LMVRETQFEVTKILSEVHPSYFVISFR